MNSRLILRNRGIVVAKRRLASVPQSIRALPNIAVPTVYDPRHEKESCAESKRVHFVHPCRSSESNHSLLLDSLKNEPTIHFHAFFGLLEFSQKWFESMQECCNRVC